jgi:DnaK suppressor protein
MNLGEVRIHLEEKRSELQEEIARLQARNPFEGSSFTSIEDVEDRGEEAREMVEMEDELSLLCNQQRLLEHVEQVLQRLDAGTYGLCSDCGQPIAEKRLQALPWATRDIACEMKRKNTLDEIS